MHKLGLDRYRLDQIPPNVRANYEERRRKAMEPPLEELRSVWG